MLLLIGVLPAAAQEDELTPEAWIPADFAGFVSLRLDQNDLGQRLNQAITAAALLQPGRIDPQQFDSFDAFVSLDILDVEDASFANDILPWLGNKIVIAYHRFDTQLTADPDDMLIILPTIDPFSSASYLSRIFEGQDLLEKVSYHDFVIYKGDKTSIALTPSVVLIGAESLVESALDLQSGQGQRLIDQDIYTTLRPAHGENPFVVGYIRGEEAGRAFSVIVNGDTGAESLLKALGDTLRVLQENGSFETTILSDDLEGAVFSLTAARRLSEIQAKITFYDPALAEDVVTTAFDPAVLNLIPRNAVIVQSGSSAVDAVYDLLGALPLSGFASNILGAFPVQIGSTINNPNIPEPATPTAQDIQAAIDDFLQAVNTVGNLDMQDDILSHLSGSYAVAILPRPNDPTPVLNTPFDLLIVSQVENGNAVLDGVTKLVQTVFDIEGLTEKTIEDFSFKTLESPTGDPILQFGLVENMLIIATGSALQPALDARRGDNRLINQERWQIVGAEEAPYLYLDINAFYNTFFPVSGGRTPQPPRQIAVRTHHLGDGLFEMQILAVIEG